MFVMDVIYVTNTIVFTLVIAVTVVIMTVTAIGDSTWVE